MSIFYWDFAFCFCVEVIWWKYVGESKIIRTIGTCFAVVYTAGWA